MSYYQCEILRDVKAAPDGINLRIYQAGEVCLLPEHLYQQFLRIGCIREMKKLD